MTQHEEEISDSPTSWVAKHIRRYIETDGQQGQVYNGRPALLLTTRGRRSGKLRRTALFYGQDGDRYLLVASNGGAPKHPAWYLNLIDHPEVEIQVGPETFAARARAATAEEKPELWQKMVELFPLYASYQAKAGREIPLVIVERVQEAV
jgi:deazaflavin-dependent oxidoreductase (nitroreductase family)